MNVMYNREHLSEATCSVFLIMPIQTNLFEESLFTTQYKDFIFHQVCPYCQAFMQDSFIISKHCKM